MSGLRYEQGTPVKRRKLRARAWCMKLAAWIMVGSSGLVGESAGPGRSVHEDAGRGLAAAACDQQRLAGGFLPCLGGQVALLGPFEFGVAGRAVSAACWRRRTSCSGATAGSTVCRLSRVELSRAVFWMEARAERIRWLAQMTTANPASRKTCVGVV